MIMGNLFKKLLCTMLSAVVIAELPPDIPLREKIKQDFTRVELRGGVKIDRGSSIVTLNLRDSDLRQVLRMLADKAGKNIIIHDSIGGQITLDLVDVELNRAFEYIMTIKELTYWQDGNTLIIAGNEDAKTLGLNMAELRGIKIRHVDAGKIADFLNTNVFSINRPHTSSSSIVTANPGTNEILVFGSREDIKVAEEVVSFLDVEPRINNFTVNYANPIDLATKICWTVFKSGDGETSLAKEADQPEGSESTLVCGSTSEFEGGDEKSGDLISFDAPAYWVLADTGLNRITIYGGTQEQLNMARQMVKNFDKREAQVYMDISIIELSESGSKSLSNAFDIASATSDSINFSGGTTKLENFEIFGRRKIHSTGDPSLIISAIEAVIKENKGRVLANPRILAANNVKSEINITSDYVEKTTKTYNTETKDLNYEVETKPIGIEFTILPKVSPNGYITLTIEPKFSTFKEPYTAGDSTTTITGSLFNTRELKIKSIRVKDGETLVLAGLVQENETLIHNKFPVLGDIPVIGALFQDQDTQKSRSELIIMITPRIVTEPDEVEAI